MFEHGGSLERVDRDGRSNRVSGGPVWRRVGLCAVLALASSSAAAISLGDAVRSALEQTGGLVRVGALQDEASAVQRQASDLIAGDPALRLKAVSDWLTSDDGAYEFEAMVDLPMWLPGQRRARVELARSLGMRADALARLLRWEIAGTVREAVWGVLLTGVRQRQAQSAFQSAQALEAVVAKRHGAGELARLDLLTAQQETFARSAEWSAAQADYEQAMARYLQLTGVSQLPQPPNQPVSAAMDDPSAGLPSDHPVMAGAKAALDGARAELGRVEADRRGTPILSFGGKRVRDDRSLPSDDALQLELSIPFGLRSQAAPGLAAAEREVTDQMTELRRMQREAERELRASVLERRATERALAVAEERAKLADAALAISERAFELGETGLDERLLAERRAREARLDLALRRMEQGQALARLNQALGVIPE